MSSAQETVVLQGHIIDSLILAKVLDTILMMGGTFDLKEMQIGATRDEPSRARILVRAPLSPFSRRLSKPFNLMEHRSNGNPIANISLRPRDGVLPDGFDPTTHLATQIRVESEWIDVAGIEMDVAISMDPIRNSARAVPMGEVRKGELIVTGREGIRVIPLERPRERDVFGFMESLVSAERPHHPVIADVARRMVAMREAGQHNRTGAKVLLAGGPAIIHAGGREALTWLIDSGFIHVLFCGNALAAHDLEAALYGTSLGYGLTAGRTVPHGHEHHLRTINRIRAIGGIQQAVETGMIKSGIMAACVERGVHVVMAGTIRDDGPLPGVITDSVVAQRAMRAAIPEVGLALLVASTLHAVATGNLLPATVPTVCVDVNPAVPTKLADRGSFQAVGLVMDAASFLKELARELGWSR